MQRLRMSGGLDVDNLSYFGGWLLRYLVTRWQDEQELWCVPEVVAVSALGHSVGLASWITVMTFVTSFPNGPAIIFYINYIINQS